MNTGVIVPPPLARPGAPPRRAAAPPFARLVSDRECAMRASPPPTSRRETCASVWRRREIYRRRWGIRTRRSRGSRSLTVGDGSCCQGFRA